MRSGFLILSHFLRRTGSHFVGKRLAGGGALYFLGAAARFWDSGAGAPTIR
jgi:hypothetical protein